MHGRPRFHLNGDSALQLAELQYRRQAMLVCGAAILFGHALLVKPKNGNNVGNDAGNRAGNNTPESGTERRVELTSDHCSRNGSPCPSNAADLESRLALALTMKPRGRQFDVRFFSTRRSCRGSLSQDDSPVTLADRQAEELLRGRISVAFPADGVFGEECDERPGTSGFRWILDPIDGTKSFIHGVPLYGMLIPAWNTKAKGVLGVVRIPALDECVYAVKGRRMVSARRRTAETDPRFAMPLVVRGPCSSTSEVPQLRPHQPPARVRAFANGRASDAHLGRLLRLFPGGHRAGPT